MTSLKKGPFKNTHNLFLVFLLGFIALIWSADLFIAGVGPASVLILLMGTYAVLANRQIRTGILKSLATR